MLAIIPARAGSKGLPGKNVFEFGGHPLIAWTIAVASESQLFSKIVVSTDSPEIGEISMRYGAEVVNRPDELSTDDASPKDAVIHAYHQLADGGYDANHIVLLQPTSPLRQISDLTDCIDLVRSNRFESAASFCPAIPHPFRAFYIADDGTAAPVNSDDDVWLPRQAREPQYHLNGAVYVVKTQSFLANPGKQFLVPAVGAHVMPTKRSIDIDTIADLKMASALMDDREPPKRVLG
jgi:CMP-N,N'-diacetyllegionaminic acid synthase